MTSPLPFWPRLMGEEMASRYLGIGTTSLRKKGPRPKSFGTRRLYDRLDLDRWADRLDGQPLSEAEAADESKEIERQFFEGRRK